MLYLDLLLLLLLIGQLKMGCICKEHEVKDTADLEMPTVVIEEPTEDEPTKFINPMKNAEAEAVVIGKPDGDVSKGKGTEKKVLWKAFTDSNGNEYYSDGSRSTWTDRRTKSERETEAMKAKKDAKSGAKKNGASSDNSKKQWKAIRDKNSGHV